MAPTKRKYNSTLPKPNKRAKNVPLSEQEYSASCILDERILQGIRKYCVKWIDIDPSTGRAYDPTWEPKEALNEALVASWEEEKAGRGIAGIASISERPGHKKSGGRPKRQQKIQLRNLNSQVVGSSPDASTVHPSSLSSTPPTSARDSIVEGLQSSAVTTPIGAPASPNHISPRVQVIRRGRSLERGAYDAHSQIPPSTSISTQLHTQEVDFETPQFLRSAYPYSSGIVPDSQSTAGDESFAPPTQQTVNTFPRSTSTGDSEGEGVTEGSGLLEIVQDAASRAISPAISPTRSIPETIAETVVNSQSQQQIASTKDFRNKFEAFDPIESSKQAEEEQIHINCENEPQVAAGSVEEWQEYSAAPISTPRCASNLFRENSPQVVAFSGPQHEETDLLTSRQRVPSELIDGPFLIGSSSSEANITTVLNGSSGEIQPIASRVSEASLAESSASQHNDQLPFHFQQAIYPESTPQQSAIQVIQHKPGDLSVEITTTVENSDHQAAKTFKDKPYFEVTADSIIVPELSHSEPPQAKEIEAGVIPQLHEQDDDLVREFLVPEYGRSPSPTVRKQHPIQSQEIDAFAQPIEVYCVTADVTCPPRDTITHSPAPCLDIQPFGIREQNAQVVPVGTNLSTEENTDESIRPTIEEEYSIRRASSESRHDSSQESPEHHLRSKTRSSSPIPLPPSHSTGTLDSIIPPRPTTPVPASPPSTMAGHDTGDEVAQELRERLAKRQAENPFTPTRRIIKSSFTPFDSASAPVPLQDPLAPPLTSARKLFQENLSLPEALEGTRSPSMVPDRSPAPQVATSLRTVALAPTSTAPDSLSNDVNATMRPDADADADADADPESTDMEAVVAERDMDLPQAESEANELDDEELSDADIDDESNESLLNDDLNLDREEYIVPLALEGRQSDMYSAYIMQNKDLLEKFLKDPHALNPLSEVDAVLSHLRAIETHIDLVFAEAEPASRTEAHSATQIEFAAQFGVENSAKFRFLHWLAHHLQNHSKRLIIVTEKDDDRLFNILETFCQAKSFNYRMPTKNRRAEPAHVQGNLIIDIFTSDESPLVQAPDLIICLDGVHEANRIRRMKWARSLEGDIVPILHLVTPRTVGHIERYISPALDSRERIHTTLASLAQMRSELGRPLDDDTPRAREAAELVFSWLITGNDDEGLSWPLPSIGSVKGVIEFQTQMSQASTTPPPPERTKRPLDDEELDSAKRRRFTPQPHAIPSSTTANNETEVTRISDSMPGSLADASSLRRQLGEMEEACRKESARRREEEQRFHEHEVMWDKQQTAHETLIREHRLLLGEKKALDEKLETMAKNNETLRERLAVKTAENRQLNEQLEEQRATHLLSEDEKIAGITQLRKELSEAHQEMQRATKNAQTAESTLEYMKEQYRLAQDAATTAQSTIELLTAENAKLMHAASGEPAKLKAIHLGRQYENKDRQLRSMSAELGNMKRALGLKEDELTRWKNNIGRVGVGTRAQSVTPQPKVRSRAASPLGGRLSNLRNG